MDGRLVTYIRLTNGIQQDERRYSRGGKSRLTPGCWALHWTKMHTALERERLRCGEFHVHSCTAGDVERHPINELFRICVCTPADKG